MAYVLITLTASLVLNLAVLTLLKIGLRDAPTTGDLTGDLRGCQPC